MSCLMMSYALNRSEIQVCRRTCPAPFRRIYRCDDGGNRKWTRLGWVRGGKLFTEKHRTLSLGRGSASAPTRTRTWNPLIKSQLLYQLSHGCGDRAARLPTSTGSQGPEKVSTAAARSWGLPWAVAAASPRFFLPWRERFRHCRSPARGGRTHLSQD